MNRLFIFLLLSLAACGVEEGKEKHVKDYRLIAATEEHSLQEQLADLVAEFNLRSGFEALQLVNSTDESNSTVSYRSGLLQQDGKLGYGRWVTETHKSGGSSNFGLTKSDKVVEYAMDLQFDREYMLKHTGLDRDSWEWQEMFLLFSHEVGHGLQMEHTPGRDDVMYYMIDDPENANYHEFFADVQRFFGIAAN